MPLKAIKLSAPGKLIICGEHSVVYGKKALASAIDLRTHLTARRDQFASDFEINLIDVKRVLRITSTEFQEIRSQYDGSQPIDQTIDSLIEARARDKQLESIRLLIMIARELEWSHLDGIRVEVKSEIPLASGLGSSASFSVCLSTLFHYLGRSNGEITDSDRLLINSSAFAVEKIFHGKPSGIDNSVACFGNYVVFEKGSIIDKFSSPIELPILVVNSLVPKQTSEQVDKVRGIHQRHPNIVDRLMSSIGEIVDEFITILKKGGKEDEGEDEAGARLNDLVTLNHGILHGFQVSNLELGVIVGLAAKFKLHAKITGSGGGGCCFILLNRGDTGSSFESIVDELNEHKFASFKTRLGCRGVVIEHIEF